MNMLNILNLKLFISNTIIKMILFILIIIPITFIIFKSLIAGYILILLAYILLYINYTVLEEINYIIFNNQDIIEYISN